MPFSGYPLPENFTNVTPATNIHPASHNNTNGAVNNVQDQVTAAGLAVREGAGSPEGVVTAPVGTIYRRTDGGTNTTLYVKETGAGNTGWVANAAGSPDGGNAGTLSGATLAQVRDRATHTGAINADSVTDGTTNKVFTSVDETKLAGIEVNATFNDLAATIDDFDVAARAAQPADVTVHWDSVADFALFNEITHSTDGVGTWTKTTPAYGVASAGAGEGGLTNRARFTCVGTGGQGGNTRVCYPIVSSAFRDVVDQETELVLWDHSGVGSGNGQLGVILNFHSIGGGRYRFISIWHDIFVSNPRLWNFNIWTTETSPGSGDSVTSVTGGGQWTFRPVLDPPLRLPILRSWRSANVAYYQLGTYEHGFIVGDSVHVVGPSLVTFAAGVLTYVVGDTIGFSLAGNDTQAGGTGYVQRGNNPTPFPMKVKAQLRKGGTIVRAKFWSIADRAEPEWGDPRYSTMWTVPSPYTPFLAGRPGIMSAHLTNAKFNEIATWSGRELVD